MTDYLAIGVAAWTFHKRFYAKTMDHPQFFAALRGAGICRAELNSPFFLSREAGYLASIKQAADDYGIQIVNIAVDDWEYDLSSKNEANRQQAVSRTTEWLDTAALLGCPNVRNNSGGDDPAQCVKSLTALAAEAQARGQKILIEAHGGFSSDAAQIVPMIEEVQEQFPNSIGLIPDFGNVIPTQSLDRYGQIEGMAPYAVLAHPKMHDFDAQGQQTEWDTQELVNCIRRWKNPDAWIIEFEGEEEDFSGLRKSIALLSQCLQMESKD